MKASEGLQYKTATGVGTMINRHVAKSMYLAECEGAQFRIVRTFDDVGHGETCSA